MAQLFIPTPLRKFTAGQATFTADASTVGDLLEKFAAAHVAVRSHLFDEAGNLRSFIRIYVGDEEFNELRGAETPVQPLTEVSIIPAIAGGIQLATT